MKKEYYNNEVLGCLKDHGALFQIINRLLHRSSASPLPSHDSPSVLAQEFADFFESKIDKLHQQLNVVDLSGLQDKIPPEQTNKTLLHSFTPVLESDVVKMIKNYPIKSCPLDPVPAFVFREVYMTMSPILTNIVNSSLSSADMPELLKEAMIKLILQKPHVAKDTLNNYRPVSNLPYVSKLIERVVAKQLVCHLEDNGLSEKYQSAYRQAHSTETALTSVMNNILMSLDQKKVVFLVLLDLSATFDTVDHTILLKRLEYWIGLRDLALD